MRVLIVQSFQLPLALWAACASISRRFHWLVRCLARAVLVVIALLKQFLHFVYYLLINYDHRNLSQSLATSLTRTSLIHSVTRSQNVPKTESKSVHVTTIAVWLPSTKVSEHTRAKKQIDWTGARNALRSAGLGQAGLLLRNSLLVSILEWASRVSLQICIWKARLRFVGLSC